MNHERLVLFSLIVLLSIQNRKQKTKNTISVMVDISTDNKEYPVKTKLKSKATDDMILAYKIKRYAL